MPEIKKIVLASNKTRYRAVVNIGPDPDTGRRRQKTITMNLRKDVDAEIKRIGHQLRTGEYVQPAKVTVNEALDRLLPALCIDVEVATARNYQDAMRPVRGSARRPAVAEPRRAGLDDLVGRMLSEGRIRGGKPVLASACARVADPRPAAPGAERGCAPQDGGRNVAAFTKIPRAAAAEAAAKRRLAPWSAPTRCGRSSAGSATTGSPRHCCSA